MFSYAASRILVPSRNLANSLPSTDQVDSTQSWLRARFRTPLFTRVRSSAITIPVPFSFFLFSTHLRLIACEKNYTMMARGLFTAGFTWFRRWTLFMSPGHSSIPSFSFIMSQTTSPLFSFWDSFTPYILIDSNLEYCSFSFDFWRAFF